MGKFRDWLENGESKDERLVRDVRALSRSLDTQNHHRNRPRTPKGLSSKELVSWVVKNGDRIQLPMSAFINRVEEEINRKLAAEGKSDVHTLFYGPQMAGISPKSTADYERLRDILQDSYIDGTTVDQAVEMGLEFIRSRGL